MLELNNPDLHEYRVYADDRAQVFAVVDAQDWHRFKRWRWCIKFSNRGRKPYLRRAVGENANRQRLRTFTLYLHVEIMRLQAEQPTSKHVVDHLNGDTLDCRRANLRWATKAQNNRNRFGSYLANRNLGF
jgi:hypothetical protein